MQQHAAAVRTALDSGETICAQLSGRGGYVVVDEGPVLHGGAAWATEDVGYALALLDRPAGDVREALQAQWDRLTALCQQQ